MKLKQKNFLAAPIMLIALSLTGIGSVVNAQTTTKTFWKCVADGIENYTYDGGDQAYIHLSSYSDGNDYEVTLNAAKTEAKGRTGDGTPFTCSLVSKEK